MAVTLRQAESESAPITLPTDATPGLFSLKESSQRDYFQYRRQISFLQSGATGMHGRHYFDWHEIVESRGLKIVVLLQPVSCVPFEVRFLLIKMWQSGYPDLMHS